MALFRHGQSAAFKVLAVFLGFSLGLLPAPTRFQISPALAATPEEDLATAFQLWRTVYFQDAIVVLDGLVVRKGVSKPVLREAYLLKGQCHLALADGDTASARDAFCGAVKADPDWDLKSGSIDLDEREVKLYARAKEECKPRGISRLLLAGAAAGAGAIVFLLVGGGSDNGTSPPPPLSEFPTQPTDP